MEKFIGVNDNIYSKYLALYSEKSLAIMFGNLLPKTDKEILIILDAQVSVLFYSVSLFCSIAVKLKCEREKQHYFLLKSPTLFAF